MQFAEIPRGAMPVLLTPFTKDNRVDFSALDELVEFYLQTKVTGLFVCCLSGEVFHLSDEENLEVAQHVVKRAGNRIAIVAGANFGPTLDDQARSIQRFHEIGVDAAVVILSGLPHRSDLLDQVLYLADKAPAPLGLYECPYPEHLLLTPDEVGRIAHTQRFIFMKETSRNVATHTAKLCAAADTPLRVFQANLRCTPDSLRAGAFGLCGIIANVCPELTALLCDPETQDGVYKERTYESLLLLQDMMVEHGYPASAKYILQLRGLRLGTFTRSIDKQAFTEHNARAINECVALYRFDRPLDEAELDRLRNCIQRVSPSKAHALNTSD